MTPYILLSTDVLHEDRFIKFEESLPLLEEISNCAEKGSTVFLCSNYGQEEANSCLQRLEDTKYKFVSCAIDISNDRGKILNKEFLVKLETKYNLTPCGIYINLFEDTYKVAQNNGIEIVSVDEKAANRYEMDYEEAARQLKSTYSNI